MVQLILLAAPFFIVGVVGYLKLVGWKLILFAECWTLISYFFTIFSTMAFGIWDCNKVDPTYYPLSSCEHDQDVRVLITLAVGLAVMIIGNWLILRRRRV